MSGPSRSGTRSKWTVPRLKRELKDLLRDRTRWVVIEKELHDTNCRAYCRWNGNGPLGIVVDPNQDGRVPLVIHECLHFLLREVFDGFDTLIEEVVVVSLTQHLMADWLERSPRLYGWFKSRIAEQLALTRETIEEAQAEG